MASRPVSDVLDGVPWLWAEGLPDRNACAGFLRSCQWRAGSPARLHLFAESLWRLYVNGRFVAAGPAPFRKPVVTVDSIDLAPFLRPGANEVFVLVRWFGETTKWILSDRPGLAACLELDGRRLSDVEGWTAWALRLWSPTPPRISWAREAVEDIDLGHADAVVLARYAGEDYAVTGDPPLPPPARLLAGPAQATTVRPRQVPPLRWGEVRPLAPPTAWRCNAEVYLIQDLARRLCSEHRVPAWDADLVDRAGPDGFRIDRRRGDKGWCLVYDLRRVCAGDLVVEIDSDTACTVDLGFSELLAGGQPDVTRSGSHYVARLHLRPGRNRCRLFAFHGFRWVLLSCRDVEGALTVRRLHARECHADLPYGDGFATSDPVLDLIQSISRRSVVLNTQAACYDCNTREIGAYWGDGLWIAEIAGHLSGDFSHLRHLARAAVDEWAAAGVINASLYGMGGPLIDYCLVPAEVLRRAWRCTGDRALAADVLPTLHEILADLEAGRDADGWLSVAAISARFAARRTDGVQSLLFLDHAGLGWHPRDSTAIDRRDANAGLQLFWLQALQAMAEVSRGAGLADRWSAQAEALRVRIAATFRDPASGLIADARLPDGSFAGASQIVNALAVTTGVLAGDEARRAMRRCIDEVQHPEIAGSTPYGYFFIVDALCRLGLVAEAVRLVRGRFVPMLERGATTTWEAWGGELHDSLNHAWSAVLPWLAIRGLAGLRAEEPGYARLALAPAIGVLDACRLRVVLPQGPLSLSWSREGSEFRIEAIMPPGVAARVQVCGQNLSWSGRQSLRIPDPSPV
jgi:hypothetical protein